MEHVLEIFHTSIFQVSTYLVSHECHQIDADLPIQGIQGFNLYRTILISGCKVFFRGVNRRVVSSIVLW